MRIVARGQFYNIKDNQDGTYTYTASPVPVNYKSGDSWKEIDCSIKPADYNDIGFDYQVIDNSFELYAKNDGTIKSNSKDDNCSITWKVTGIGYYDSRNNRLQNIYDFHYDSNQIVIDNNRLVWNNVSDGIDVELLVTSLRMQTNVILSEQARKNLPNPIIYGIVPNNAEIVIIYEYQLSGHKKVHHTNGHELSIDKTSMPVTIENLQQKLSFFLPDVFAYSLDNPNPNEKISIHRRFFNDGLKNYIYEGIDYNRLFELQDGPVVFDDSVEYTANGLGTVANEDVDYIDCQEALSGTDVSTSELTVGQNTTFAIFRSFINFDTSGLDDSAIISAANLKLKCAGDQSATDFNVLVVSHSAGSSLTTGDYNNYGGTVYGTWNTSGYSGGSYITISLNSTGISAINKTGTTYYGLISYEDLYQSEPTGNEYVWFDSHEDSGGEPKLEITYTLPSSSSSSSSESSSNSSSSSSESTSSSSSSESTSNSSSSSSSSSSESVSSSSSSESTSISSSSSSESTSESFSSSSSSFSSSSSSSSFSSSSSSSQSGSVSESSQSSSSSSSESESVSNSSSSSSESQSESSSNSSSESVSSSSESSSNSSSSSQSVSSSSVSTSSESSSFSSESVSFSSSSSESTSFSSSSESSSSSSSSFSSSSSSSRSSSSSSSQSSSVSSESSSDSESSSSSSSSLQASAGPDIALRINHATSYEDFTIYEVETLKVQRIQGIDRFWKQSGYVHQYRTGKQYRKITVTFSANYSKNTLSKAENIWDCVDSYYHPLQLQVYYKMKIDPTACIMAQLDRDSFNWPFVAGYQAAQPIQMVFIENKDFV